MHAHAAEHGGDPDKMFVVGHSAGAYLTGLLATDERYLAKRGLGLANIRGAAPISGFFHVDRIAPGRTKSIWGEDAEAWAVGSPANHASDSAPPILLLYADGDTDDRKKESRDFAAKLTAKGAHASHAEIADRTHVTLVTKFRGDGDETAAKVIAFIRDCLASGE
jgi:acetyl esterase/lipase